MLLVTMEMLSQLWGRDYVVGLGCMCLIIYNELKNVCSHIAKQSWRYVIMRRDKNITNNNPFLHLPHTSLADGPTVTPPSLGHVGLH